MILPRRCVSCGNAADLLCGPCVHLLRLLAPPQCALCGAPTAWPVERCRECAGRQIAFASARAAIAYAGPARAFVRAWKEHAVRRAGALAAELVAAHVERPPADVITYIPPDPARQLRRAEHPAERLAAELSARWELDPARLLARTRSVRRQTGLSLKERRRNIRGAFTAIKPVPECVVLVDDVYTTGATASAAASALRSAGATTVHVVTFARAVR